MAGWQDLHGVVLRASNIRDPEDTDGDGFIEVELAAYEVVPVPTLVGRPRTDGNGYMTNPRKFIRYRVDIDWLEFSKRSGDVDFMSFGLYLRTVREVFRRRYVWIYRVYQTAANHGAGPLPRSDYDRDTPTGNADTLWNARSATTDDYPYEPAGILPLEVAIPEEIPEPDSIGSGVYEWSIELYAAEVEAP